MDVHDVSKAPGYLQHLRGQKKILRDAQSQKGQRPSAATSREVIIREFMSHVWEYKIPTGPPAIRSAFIPPVYSPSVTPLAELEKVMIDDLTLETHHRGSYVLLKAVTPTSHMIAVMAIMEDEKKDVIRLQLYNYGQEHYVDDRLHEGTVLIVKEPYLKVNADGGFGIRVDHMSDIMFIPEHDDLLPLSWRPKITELDLSADDWKLKGNEFLKHSRYLFAIECYSKALDCSPTNEEVRTIRLIRALAFLRTNQFEAALDDLEDKLWEFPPSEEFLVLKSQALYYLQRFRESCAVHTVRGKLYPRNNGPSEEFNRAIARLSEQTTGKYQFKKMQREAARIRPLNPGHATYIGSVAVGPTHSCGRGLFTTKAVKAGDLLFCEKAFSYVFHPGKGDALYLLLNLDTDSMTVGFQVELLDKTVQKLRKNPSLIPAFNDLYHGTYRSVGVTEVDGIPVVDTFLTERIMSLNYFGCPLSTCDTHKAVMKAEPPVESTERKFYSCGIWLLASYINHSCYGNARRSFIGDMMVLRATSDLPPKTEIVFQYKSPSIDSPRDGEMDFTHWGFKCTCIMCQDNQKTGDTTFAKRRRLGAKLARTLRPNTEPNTANIEAMILRMADTYRQPAIEVPRLAIWDTYLTLALTYTAQKKTVKAIESAFKTLESLGYVIEGGRPPFAPNVPLLIKKWGLMMDGLVGCWMCLCINYRKRYPWFAAQAEEYARISYRICVGEDETFYDTYSKGSERADGIIDYGQISFVL